METLKQKIMNILYQFRQEELGNRLSQFATQSLIVNIEQEFDNAILNEKNKKEPSKSIPDSLDIGIENKGSPFIKK